MTKTQSKIVTLALLTLITAVLLISATNVNAAAVDTKSQSISALNSVIGIKTDSYSITQNTKQDNLYGAPQERVNSFFTSEQGSFRVTFSYTKGYLNQIYFSDIKGTIQTSQPKTSYIENSKQFLNNFGKYTGDSIYNQFASMLNNIESGKNANITSKNVNLIVTNRETSSSIIWTYADSNGLKANDKRVEFSYENGQLIGFINNWQLYKVAGTPKLSADQATSLAIEASKTFSYEATVDNKTQKVSGFSFDPKSLGHGILSYANFYESKSARDSDPFILYPLWYFNLGFDKFYPGDVSGLTVAIWADTGKIAGMHELTVDSSFGNSTSAASLSQVSDSLLTQVSIFSVPILLIILASTILISPIYYKRFKRTRFLNRKILTIFFTGLILLSLVLTATSQANAAVKSRIYSIEHCLDTDNGYHNDVADVAEAIATAEICNYVGNLTQNHGYDTTNSHGSETTRSNVLGDITADEQGFDKTILLHLGHFTSPMGRAYQDDTGQDANKLLDTDIYDLTSSSGKHSFVFIWVCNCANNPGTDPTNYANDKVGDFPVTSPTVTTAPGVPIAWTHRDDQNRMNYDGFSYPDGSGQCYISFKGMSPMLSGLPVHTFDYNSPTNCKDFLEKFYEYSISGGYSVHAALDLASQYYFGSYLASSVLSPLSGMAYGYYTWWPGGDFSGEYEPLSDPGYYPTEYGDLGIDPNTRNQMKVHGDSNMHIAYMQTLNVTSSSGGSTNLDGVHSINHGNTVTVTATPSSGKVLSSWVLDGSQNLGNALSVDIPMSGDHSLSANFIDAPSNNDYAYDIQSCSDTDSPYSLTGYQPDGYYATLMADPNYGRYGSVVATLNAQSSGHVAFYASGFYASLSVEVSNSLGGGWVSLGSQALTETYQWVNYGGYASSFRYVRLTAGGSNGLSIDSIRVSNYTLTVSSATGGSTNTTTGMYYQNVVNVLATPSTNYYLDHWLLNGTDVGSNNPYAVTMNNNYVIQPVFYPNTLTISSTNGGSTNTTTGNYTYGQTAVVKATASPGYYFDHWQLDGNNVGSNDPISVTMYRSHTLQAVFAPLTTYRVTISAWSAEPYFELNPTIYVDGVPYSAPTTVWLTSGYHTIAAECPYIYWSSCDFSDGLGNGASRMINSEREIVVTYYM